MDLKTALTKIQFDKELTMKFLDDPKKILEDMGVNTKELIFSPMQEDKVMTKNVGICARVCANVGVPFIGCHEVGSNAGI